MPDISDPTQAHLETARKTPTFIDRRLEQAHYHGQNDWLINSTFCDTFGHWSYSRAAAMSAARASGVCVVAARVSEKPSGIIIEQAFDSTLIPTKTLFDFPGIKRGFEEEGGAGLSQCFDFIDQHSSAPIVDIQSLLRWVICSYILGHTEQHAGHVMLVKMSGATPGWRLAPFEWMTAFAAAACNTRYMLPKGMRIGSNFPDDHIMVHHLVGLSKFARVKPKIVFSMAYELAETLPFQLKIALDKEYKTTSNSTASRILQMVVARSQRIKDVCMTAPVQGVAGIKRNPIERQEIKDDPVLIIRPDGTERKFYRTEIDTDLDL